MRLRYLHILIHFPLEDDSDESPCPRMHLAVYYLVSNNDGSSLIYSLTFPLTHISEEKCTSARIFICGLELYDTDFSSQTTIQSVGDKLQSGK